jgi:hypothetical protein
MFFSAQRFTLVVALLAARAAAYADAPIDPTGHWEGAIHAPAEDVVVSVDIAADASGKLTGTFSNPAARLKNFPLWNVAVDGRSLKLEIKTGDPGVQAFVGTLGEDGRSIGGEFLVSVYGVPFSLERTGAARVATAPRSPAVYAVLAGAWSGSITAGGREMPVVLTMTNHADRTATATWAAGEGVATPVAIKADGASLTLESTVAPAEYSGTVSADGTRISGTIKQGPLEQPLTFTRVAAAR